MLESRLVLMVVELWLRKEQRELFPIVHVHRDIRAPINTPAMERKGPMAQRRRESVKHPLQRRLVYGREVFSH
jgi:hypothetical protein